MPITVKDLMQSRKELALVSSQYDESVQTALEKMREKDFSQLPVVGSDGKLIGMITSNSILNALQIFGIAMNELRVSHAAEKVSAYKEDDELSDVFSDVRRNGAVVVQAREGQKPIGIITTYDMSEFYSQRAENIILLNNIETTLKEHIRAAFDDQIELAEAIEEVPNRTSKNLDKFKKAIKHYKNLEKASEWRWNHDHRWCK